MVQKIGNAQDLERAFNNLTMQVMRLNSEQKAMEVMLEQVVAALATVAPAAASAAKAASRNTLEKATFGGPPDRDIVLRRGALAFFDRMFPDSGPAAGTA